MYNMHCFSRLLERSGKLRKSSLRVYNSRWNHFSSWCLTKRISPWNATKQQIADFLFKSLFQEGKLKVSTIEGYKSAIAAILKPGGTNVGSDPHLCGLVNSFYTDRLVERNKFSSTLELISSSGCSHQITLRMS